MTCHYPYRASSCMAATSSTASLSVTREQTKSSPTSGTPCATQGTTNPCCDNLQRLVVSLSVKRVWPTRPHLTHCSLWQQTALRQRPERKKGLWLATRRRHSVFPNGQDRVLCPWAPGVAVKPQTRHFMLRCRPARQEKKRPLAIVCGGRQEKREHVIGPRMGRSIECAFNRSHGLMGSAINIKGTTERTSS